MMITVGIAAVFLLLLCFLLWRSFTRSRLPDNFPPGPLNLPIIGGVLHLNNDILESFKILRKKYGNIFGLRIGTTPCVVISDFDTCVKTFKDSRFAARPTYLTNVMGSIMAREGDDPHVNKGVVFSTGHVWDEQRKFILKKLSEFGMDKSGMEDSVLEQVEKLVAKLINHGNEGPVNLLDKFNISIINSMWNMVADSQFELDDPLILQLYENIEVFITQNRLIGIIMVFPWLKHIISLLCPGKTLKLKNNMRDMMNKIVDDQLETYSEDVERHLVDSFITKINKTKDTSSSFFGLRGRNNLEANMLELFGAGANPVSTTLSFCFLFFAHHPEIQSKVVTEIQDIVGTCHNSPVQLKHQSSLPYTMAFLYEVLRITAINFIGTPHMNVEATQLEGYSLPAGTTVFAFLWHIMNDEEYWDRPREFRPERFIDSNGQFVKDERLIPFLIGKRRCLGIALAQTSLFLFLANIIKRVSVSEASSHPLPAPVPTMGFVMGCPNFYVKLEEREQARTEGFRRG